MRFEDGANELRFKDVRKFGFLLCLDGPPETSCGELASLGPEPLEVGFDEFAAILGARKGRVKALLLDQTRLAGIGNIYADEMLFEAGIHPETPASLICKDKAARLFVAMKRILAAAIEANGSTLQDYRDAEGREGSFQFSHQVYDRTGEPCVKCGRPVRKTVVAGRGTHFCPSCQPKRRAA